MPDATTISTIAHSLFTALSVLLVYVWSSRKKDVDDSMAKVHTRLDHIEATASSRWSAVNAKVTTIEVEMRVLRGLREKNDTMPVRELEARFAQFEQQHRDLWRAVGELRKTVRLE